MTIETIVRGSGITAGGRIWLQDVTTGTMLFLALILQSAILSRRGKGSFKDLTRRRGGTELTEGKREEGRR